MPHRRTAVLVLSLTLTLVLAACGNDAPADVATTPSGVPGTSRVTTTTPTSTTAGAETTDTTAAPPRPTSPPATSPPGTDPPVTAAPGRTVALGEAFFIAVGETVTIPAESLSVTFGNVGPDNRCPPGVQCITAGNASIGVLVSKAAAAAVLLVLNTTEGPKSASYGSHTVELVRLNFGSSPSATLRVT